MTIRARHLDPSLSVEERVADLLSQMTLTEKIAQLGSVWGFQIVPGGHVDRKQLERLLGNGLGEITRIAGATNLTLPEAARAANEIQRYLIEGTRLGIPAIVHEETLHGLLARDAPVFQQSIGAAASYDPELVEQVAAAIRRRMRAMGARHALAPVLDVTRDPRWGRIEETYGEDPYLAATLGVAYVRGIQGSSPADGVLATGKHLVGHGLAEGGLNQAPAHVGWRELRDEQLLPFEAAIREAGLASVMPAYCDVDGVPCHASRELLVDVLRREWAFDGLVASDYMGIEQLQGHHRLTPDMGVAAGLALAAGVDLELPRSLAYAEPLAQAIADGRVEVALIDAAVARVLSAKVRLGLFEQPYVDEPSAADAEVLLHEERRLGRQLAARSMVLLENDGVLPLSGAVRRLALIGPIADSARDLLGDYSHLLHVETLLELANQPMFGVKAQGALLLEDELAGRRTILDAFRDRLGPELVRHARGTGLRDGSDEELAAAVAAAREAEVAVLVLGERSGLTDDSTTGEFRDRRGLGLLGRQQELLEAVVATGTPVVLVVVSGRPLAIEWAARHCAAVLLAWVPGDEGPDALLDVLLGEQPPGGKLPVSMPRGVGQVPLHYRHHPSGGRSNPRGDHVDGQAGPLWPFGFGRSYTTFALSDLALDRPSIASCDDEVGIGVRVANVGPRPGDEVVQLYLRDEEADIARPVLELCGFVRVSLEPGESADVRFTLHSEQLSHTGLDYRRIVEPGSVTLWVGTSSADRPLSATLAVTGPVAELPVRCRFVTPVSVRRA
jgi:beta-glucosidase